MAQKILYFTADSIPTTAEAADIAHIGQSTVPLYDLVVLNVKESYLYGSTIPADYVAGAVPAVYSAYNTVTVSSLPINFTPIQNNANVTLTFANGTETATTKAVVANYALTGVTLATDKAVVTHDASVTVLASDDTELGTGKIVLDEDGILTAVKLTQPLA